MARYRRRPQWDDFEMMEDDIAYDRAMAYDMAYRRRLRELEIRDRMQEWDMIMLERRDRPPFEEREGIRPPYPVEDISSHPITERGEYPPFEGRGGNQLPYPAEDIGSRPGTEGGEGIAEEVWNPYEEWGGEQEGTWATEEQWEEAEGEEMNAEWNGHQDQTYGEGAGEMEEEDDEDEVTKEEKLVFKLKRYTAIPLSYLGPIFDSRFSQFLVTVSPIALCDAWNTSFTSITTNAISFKLDLGTKRDGHYPDSSLILMIKDSRARHLMRGVMTQNFRAASFSVRVEQHEIERGKQLFDEDGVSIFFPKISHTASFKVNNKSICEHANRVSTADENSEDKRSALKLHNLPKSVDWTFLRVLFPFGLSGQMIEETPRSALMCMKSPKMALLHLASITDLQIDGQPIQMKMDMPPQEAVQMLRETEDDAPPPPDRPKKKKKLSPSDIRRNLKKQREYADRLAKISKLPQALPFPGMSFPGPGNMPPQRTPVSAFSGAAVYKGDKPSYIRNMASNKTSGTSNDTTGDFSDIPIPQMLEGPYPPASDYYAPGTASAPGTSQKLRTAGYFRRRGSRVAVHLCHLWGGNIQLATKALMHAAIPEEERKKFPPLVPPPHMLSTKTLTDFQLQKMKKKVKENVSLAEMRKAEDHWQRKRKEREAAGRSAVPRCVQNQSAAKEAGASEQSPEMTRTKKVQKDRQRMTEYNQKKSAEAQPYMFQQNASGRNNATKATGFQRNVPTQGGRDYQQMVSSTKPAPQKPGPAYRDYGWGQQQQQQQQQQWRKEPAAAPGGYPPQQYSGQQATSSVAPNKPVKSKNFFFQPPPPKPGQPSQNSSQNQYRDNRDQSAERFFQPPPPLPPPAKPMQSPQNRYSQPPFHQPPQFPQDQFAHPRPPRPAQTSTPNTAQSSQIRPPPPPSPRHPYSQPPPHHMGASTPRPPAQQSQYQQQGSAFGAYGQDQQQRRREPAAASEGQGYSEPPPQQFDGFWQKWGSEGSAKNQQSGMNQRRYNQQY